MATRLQKMDEWVKKLGYPNGRVVLLAETDKGHRYAYTNTCPSELVLNHEALGIITSQYPPVFIPVPDFRDDDVLTIDERLTRIEKKLGSLLQIKKRLGI